VLSRSMPPGWRGQWAAVRLTALPNQLNNTSKADGCTPFQTGSAQQDVLRMIHRLRTTNNIPVNRLIGGLKTCKVTSTSNNGKLIMSIDSLRFSPFPGVATTVK